MKITETHHHILRAIQDNPSYRELDFLSVAQDIRARYGIAADTKNVGEAFELLDRPAYEYRIIAVRSFGDAGVEWGSDRVEEARELAEIAAERGEDVLYRVFGPKGYVTSYLSYQGAVREHADVTIPQELCR